MSIASNGWKIDHFKFRIYLKDHYNIRKAYMFMGYKPSEQQMYNVLQTAGFILIFKPLLELYDGKVKGNCDAELVLQAMIDYKKYSRALIVTGDGDFHCLIKYLREKEKLLTVLAPTSKNCSSLITKLVNGNLALVSNLRRKIEYTNGHEKRL